MTGCIEIAGETSVIRAIIADTGDGAAGSAGKIWTIKVDIRSCLNMVITAQQTRCSVKQSNDDCK